MVFMVNSLLRVMKDFYHQPYRSAPGPVGVLTRGFYRVSGLPRLGFRVQLPRG